MTHLSRPLLNPTSLRRIALMASIGLGCAGCGSPFVAHGVTKVGSDFSPPAKATWSTPNCQVEKAKRITDVMSYTLIDYNGAPAGYTADPQENIVYVDKHDNQTFFDVIQLAAPAEATLADRARMAELGHAIVLLSQLAAAQR